MGIGWSFWEILSLKRTCGTDIWNSCSPPPLRTNMLNFVLWEGVAIRYLERHAATTLRHPQPMTFLCSNCRMLSLPWYLLPMVPTKLRTAKKESHDFVRGLTNFWTKLKNWVHRLCCFLLCPCYLHLWKSLGTIEIVCWKCMRMK